MPCASPSTHPARAPCGRHRSPVSGRAAAMAEGLRTVPLPPSRPVAVASQLSRSHGALVPERAFPARSPQGARKGAREGGVCEAP